MSDLLDDPTLRDPDADSTVTKYNWDKEFQRHIAALLVADRQFVLENLDIIQPTYFTDKAHSKVISFVFEFFKKYRLLPKKDFIVQHLKDALKDNKSLLYYLSELNILFDYFQPGMESRDYLRDRVNYFAKIVAVKSAFHECLALIDKAPESDDTWDSIYDTMKKAMVVNSDFQIGCDYFKSMKDRYIKQQEDIDQNKRFVLGLPGIDMEITGGGWLPGQAVSIVANSGGGKSVMLACMAATNLLRGKRGVYITLEIPEEMVATRMDAILSEFPIQLLQDQQGELFEKLNNLDGVAYGGEIYPLVIKKFPAKTATVNTIRAYLAQLKFHNFTPDFVIVDYIGEMKHHANMKIYESRELLTSELVGLAEEEMVFLATAMQPNREGKKESKAERGKIDSEHLGDAFGQIRPLAGCFSLNQNETEKKLGIGRCCVIKIRDGVDGLQIYLRFDKKNLKITEVSRDEYLRIYNAHKEVVSEETAIDMVVQKWKPTES